MKHQLSMAISLLSAILLMFTGCAPQTSPTKIAPTEAEAFSGSGTQKLQSQWWEALGDEQLNRLMDEALEENFDIMIAWQRLAAARAETRGASASFFPTLDARAGARVNRPARSFQREQDFSIDLTASYEVDLWGRIGSRVDAQRFREEATYYDYHAARISLTAEVARTWYQLLEANRQKDIITEQIATNKKVLNLLRTRFGSGQVRSVDILRQEQLLERTREQQIGARQRIRLLENRLSVLSGQPPQEGIPYNTDSLPSLPGQPESGLPAALIQRRPDVQSAYQQLKAADRDLAAAISNRYPRISLSASLTIAAEDPGNLFNDFIRSFAGNLLAPIFYGGELKAEADRSEAVKQQAAYEYGQAILTAYQEVEDALVREKAQQETIESLEKQMATAQKTYEQLRMEYFNGMSGYLDVLTALDDVQQLSREATSARLLLLEYRIALHRALAGAIGEEQ